MPVLALPALQRQRAVKDVLFDPVFAAAPRGHHRVAECRALRVPHRRLAPSRLRRYSIVAKAMVPLSRQDSLSSSGTATRRAADCPHSPPRRTSSPAPLRPASRGSIALLASGRRAGAIVATKQSAWPPAWRRAVTSIDARASGRTRTFARAGKSADGASDFGSESGRPCPSAIGPAGFDPRPASAAIRRRCCQFRRCRDRDPGSGCGAIWPRELARGDGLSPAHDARRRRPAVRAPV